MEAVLVMVAVSTVSSIMTKIVSMRMLAVMMTTVDAVVMNRHAQSLFPYWIFSKPHFLRLLSKPCANINATLKKKEG